LLTDNTLEKNIDCQKCCENPLTEENEMKPCKATEKQLREGNGFEMHKLIVNLKNQMVEQ